MIYYKTLRLLISIVSILTFILTPITTFLLGIFGFIPIVGQVFALIQSIVWSVIFLFPLMGFSWVSKKLKWLAPIISIIAIPLSLLGFIFANLTPSWGDWNGRFNKILIASVFPYNYQVFNLIARQIPPDDYSDSINIEKVLKMEAKNPVLKPYIERDILPYL